MSCFGFKMLDGSINKAETGQSEENNRDRAELYHDINCSGGIIGM